MHNLAVIALAPTHMFFAKDAPNLKAMGIVPSHTMYLKGWTVFLDILALFQLSV